MKKYLSISLTSVATLIILLSAVIPHHHHGERVCIIMDLCDVLDGFDSAHENHGGNDDIEDDKTCVFEKEYLTSSPHDDLVFKIGANDDQPSLSHFLLFYINENRLKKYISRFGSQVNYEEYIDPHGFSFLEFCKGLRSPPLSIS